MSELIKKYKGFDIHIEADMDPIDPRKEWDNFGNMICFHDNYNLGDKNNMSIEEVQEITSRKDVICLPIYLYDHSGLTINTTGFNCPWDSGLVGCIFAEHDKIKNEWGKKRISKNLKNKILNLLRNEVETYDHYLTGNVYSYFVKDKQGNIIDSCCGFFGYDFEKNGIMEYARNAIDATIEQHNKSRQSKTKSYIKNKVPFVYRHKQLECQSL